MASRKKAKTAKTAAELMAEKTAAFKKSWVGDRQAAHHGQKERPAPAQPMAAEDMAAKTAAFQASHRLARQAAHAGKKVRNV